ncbi:hypothetical protein [Burkholderia stagnalis]|uniref:hypothetical protein n=1 Tax=Burkholderia stagnalis TaxID=1503054 RepID=UPI000B2DD258|nr:hypothetical protein [Burkholderia stagnalis]
MNTLPRDRRPAARAIASGRPRGAVSARCASRRIDKTDPGAAIDIECAIAARFASAFNHGRFEFRGKAAHCVSPRTAPSKKFSSEIPASPPGMPPRSAVSASALTAKTIQQTKRLHIADSRPATKNP